MSKTRTITIVIALTDDLIIKSASLFASLNKNASDCRKCILIIKKPGSRIEKLLEQHYVDIFKEMEVQIVDLHSISSYRPGWPANRTFYVCAEGGEFLDHFEFESDEIIIKLDADFIMQRQMSEEEWMNFQVMSHNIIFGNYTTYPFSTLREEYWKLLPNFGYQKARQMYPGDWNGVPIFCAGFIACTAATYRRISKAYLYGHKKIVQVFGHHAAGQWLINWIVGTQFNFQNQSPSLHNGSWYIDSPCYEKENQLCYQDQIVLFNHTKYLKDYTF